jgi:hypothetical protein
MNPFFYNEEAGAKGLPLLSSARPIPAEHASASLQTISLDDSEHLLHSHRASVASLRLLFTFAPERRSASRRNRCSPSPEYPGNSQMHLKRCSTRIHQLRICSNLASSLPRLLLHPITRKSGARCGPRLRRWFPDTSFHCGPGTAVLRQTFRAGLSVTSVATPTTLADGNQVPSALCEVVHLHKAGGCARDHNPVDEADF